MSWPMKTPREPQAVSWKPLTFSTSWRSFWLKFATSSHECAFICGSAAWGGSGVGIEHPAEGHQLPQGASNGFRAASAPRSFFNAGDHSNASQSLSSKMRLERRRDADFPARRASASAGRSAPTPSRTTRKTGRAPARPVHTPPAAATFHAAAELRRSATPFPADSPRIPRKPAPCRRPASAIGIHRSSRPARPARRIPPFA